MLIFIAHDPGVRRRDIDDRVKTNQHPAHRIPAGCDDGGDSTRQRNGWRNRPTINAHLALPDPIAPRQNPGKLPEIPTDPRTVKHRVRRPARTG